MDTAPNDATIIGDEREDVGAAGCDRGSSTVRPLDSRRPCISVSAAIRQLKDEACCDGAGGRVGEDPGDAAADLSREEVGCSEIKGRGRRDVGEGGLGQGVAGDFGQSVGAKQGASDLAGAEAGC